MDGAEGLIAESPSAAELEVGRKLFAAECTFMKGVVALQHLPEPGAPEVAFAGRSNVGKSSLINALTNRKTLARTSNTPGRTRELNFFDLGGRLRIVDMPGYGYAKVPKPMADAWTRLIFDYLRGRAELRLLCLLVDSRHGIKPSDTDLMELLDKAAVPFRIVLTKADKVHGAGMTKLLSETEAALKKHPAAAPLPLSTSAAKFSGIDELRALLAAQADAPLN